MSLLLHDFLLLVFSGGIFCNLQPKHPDIPYNEPARSLKPRTHPRHSRLRPTPTFNPGGSEVVPGPEHWGTGAASPTETRRSRRVSSITVQCRLQLPPRLVGKVRDHVPKCNLLLRHHRCSQAGPAWLCVLLGASGEWKCQSSWAGGSSLRFGDSGQVSPVRPGGPAGGRGCLRI